VHGTHYFSRARLEIEQLIGLINLLTGPQPQVSLFYINKPIVPESHGELAIREVTKQKQLQTAASILAEGASRLKKIVHREQIFFDDLLQIRSRWLISNKQPLASRKAPSLGKLYVDYGYRSGTITVFGILTV
jgi:hypothetical protein